MTPRLSNQYQDYRLLLSDILFEKTRRNPSYSLRSFAKMLDVSPALLSGVLKGKKGLSFEKAYSIADRLKMNELEKSFFCDLVQAEHARSPIVRKMSKTRVEHALTLKQDLNSDASIQYQQIESDVQEAMSHWYYFGFLDLMDCKDFRSDPKWIASTLGLSVQDVREMLDRMLRLKLIREDAHGYHKTNENITTTCDVPSSAIRNTHSEILNLAKAALAQPVENRNYTVSFIPTDAEQVKKAKPIIEKFYRDLSKVMKASSKRDRLYCLGTQLFELTHNEEEI